MTILALVIIAVLFILTAAYLADLGSPIAWLFAAFGGGILGGLVGAGIVTLVKAIA